MSIVGLLHSGTKTGFSKPVEALKKKLGSEATLKEDTYANDNKQLLKDYAKLLVQDASVDVIIAAGGPQPALAAKQMTDTLQSEKPRRERKPIVFTTVANPVDSGLVDAMDRPGGNVTGMWGKTSELDVTRMELLNVLVPNDATKPERRIGVLTRKDRPRGNPQFAELEAKAKILGIKLKREDVEKVDEIKKAFEQKFKGDVVAVIVTADSFFYSQLPKVVEYANAASLPTIYQWCDFVEAGGLISYGPSIIEAYENAGLYALRILSGDNPADIPVAEPSRLDPCLNLATARMLKIEVPQKLQGQTVRTIE
jgi:putative ABC transport system substrate-binding protein